MPDAVQNGDGMLNPLSRRYPEKTFYLGQVFNDTTNSYKLVWFLAILSLMRRTGADTLALDDILAEMATVAWHPVCLFRLSLGSQDKLQKVILDVQGRSDLELNEAPDSVRDFLNSSPNAKTHLGWFGRYVPTRFLSPWFAEKLRGLPDSQKDAKIRQFAEGSQSTPFASPYWFRRDTIVLNPSWQCFFLENAGVVQAFAEHHFALYLQSRNPNVPGVVNKLRAPTERQLGQARQFWNLVREEFNTLGRATRFRDIYSNRPIAANFSIDHFLPWSFVVHDLFWNLAPVEPPTNSSKNDALPDLDLYLPRLASIHFDAIAVAKKKPKLLEDYTDCFRLGAGELVSLTESDLRSRFREIITPQAQIAINQGFQSGWRFSASAGAIEIPFVVAPAAVGGRSAPADTVPVNIIELFPEADQVPSATEYLPFYTVQVAAGGFKGDAAPEPQGWVHASKHGFRKRIGPGMFVTQIIGHSMEPTIKDGSYCVFQSPVVGSRQGRVLLVQKRGFTDPETGGNYTVKRYQSKKAVTEQGWRHERIELVPDNPDRERFPVLTFTPEDDTDLRVISEFIQMLTPSR